MGRGMRDVLVPTWDFACQTKSPQLETPVFPACIGNSDPGSMKVCAPTEETFDDTNKQRKKGNPGQIVTKLRDSEAMLNAGKNVAAVPQILEIGEAALAPRGRRAPPRSGRRVADWAADVRRTMSRACSRDSAARSAQETSGHPHRSRPRGHGGSPLKSQVLPRSAS